MKSITGVLAFVAAALFGASAAQADVFNMDPGLTTLAIVPVGSPGNAGGFRGPDRICAC